MKLFIYNRKLLKEKKIHRIENGEEIEFKKLPL